MQHLIHGFEAGVTFQQSLFLQRFGDLQDQFAAASGGVGESSQNPDGRCVECENAEQLDAVTRGALENEVFGQAPLGWVYAFHLSDFFNQKTQRDIDHGSIQGGPAYAGGQRHVADFA